MKVKNTIGFAVLVISVFASTMASALARTIWYKYSGYQPNMAPEMFVIFSPVIAAPLALAAGIIHGVFRSYFSYTTATQWFIAGVSYGALTLALISPWLLLVLLIVNPVVAKRYFTESKVPGAN